MTTLRSRTTSKTVDIVPSIEPGGVAIGIESDDTRARTVVHRAQFLDAVRSELGVLVIDKADNPMSTEQAVAIVQSIQGIHRTPTSTDLASAVETARSLLSAVDHLEAHPLDDPQVLTLADLIRDAGEAIDFTEFARRLIATGKVTVQS